MNKISAKRLSKYVIERRCLHGRPVSVLELQRIMFILQVIFCFTKMEEEIGNFSSPGRKDLFVNYGRRFLLFDDLFEASPYGPVIPGVFRKLRASHGMRVIETFDHVDISDCIDFDTKEFIDEGIIATIEKSPWDLVKFINAPESPWGKVWDDGKGRGKPIPNTMILEYVYDIVENKPCEEEE